VCAVTGYRLESAVSRSNIDVIRFTTGFGDTHLVLVDRRCRFFKQNCSIRYGKLHGDGASGITGWGRSSR